MKNVKHDGCPFFCASGHQSRRPNTAWHDSEPGIYPVYLCGHNNGQKSSVGSTRCPVNFHFQICLQLLWLVPFTKTRYTFLLLLSSSFLGQPQQALTQMGRGQPGSTAVPGSTPVQTGQRLAGPTSSPSTATSASGQSPIAPPQTNRPQQGQVKLTMAQLMQLTQGAQVRGTFFLLVFPLL